MTWSCFPATSRWPSTIATSSPTSPGSDRLPGTKVVAPGNHDRWWNDIEPQSGRCSGGRDARRRGGRNPGDSWPHHRAGPGASRPGVMILRRPAARPGRAGRRTGESLDRGPGHPPPLSLKAADEPIVCPLALSRRSTCNRRPGAGRRVGSKRSRGSAHCVYGHLHAEGPMVDRRARSWSAQSAIIAWRRTRSASGRSGS